MPARNVREGAAPTAAPPPSQASQPDDSGTRIAGRSDIPTPPVLAAALRYAAAGWPVHPCRPGGKPPLLRWRDAATTDPATIERWWWRWPAANVGIATGAPGPDVIDIDVTNGKPGEVSLARLRDAGLLAGSIATVRTWSGGLHIYFAGTGQSNGTLARHGVDFRGRGGYVVAPPSMVEGRPYELVAHRPPTGTTVDWQAIRRLLDPPRRRPPRADRTRGAGDHSGLVRFVAGLAPGGRNAGLYWAACRAVESGADGQAFADLVSAAVSAGLPQGEAERTVRSAQRAEVIR